MKRGINTRSCISLIINWVIQYLVAENADQAMNGTLRTVVVLAQSLKIPIKTTNGASGIVQYDNAVNK